MTIFKNQKLWIAIAVLVILGFFAVRSDFVQYSVIPIVYPQYGRVHYENPDIPAGFLYTDGEEIPGEFRVSTPSISLRPEGLSSWYCNDLDRRAEIIKYYRFSPGYSATGGSNRSAVVCGNEYLITSFDGSGPGVYGPFKLERITNAGNLYSIEIPTDWKLTEDHASVIAVENIDQSSLTAESPDWKERTETNNEGPCVDSYFEAGAHLEIYTQEGEEKDFTHYGHGGGIDPEEVTQEKNITIDGVPAVYHVFTDNCTVRLGQQLDAHLNHEGTSYYFRLNYNPTQYPQGEKIFMDILNSVKFIK